MIFQNTPDTKAPVEMNTYLPDFKALWMPSTSNPDVIRTMTTGQLSRLPRDPH